MSDKRSFWIVWLILLILSAYFVPFLVLNDVKLITGSFLYWVLFALVAIFSTIKITNYWRD